MKKILFHGTLIILLLSIPIISSPDFDGSLSVFQVVPFLREFIRFVLCIVFFYLNLFIFLPKFFAKEQYVKFGVGIALCFAVVVFVPNLLVPQVSRTTNTTTTSPPQNTPPNLPELSSKPQLLPSTPPPNNPSSPNFIENESSLSKKIFGAILPFLFTFLISFFIFKSDEQRELERAKAKAELLNLKYQLQPHFLFNILNSIYSLTLLQSEDAPEGILKLSNVMRYVVQESDQDWVELDKEIKYLKDYIALQLLRTDDTLDFTYTDSGNFGSHKIAPLILVNFIENAFKYGFNTEEKSKISVNIALKGNTLTLQVFNNIVNHTIKEKDQSRIGLRNTIERLKRIYPKHHQIEVKETPTTFDVKLTLELI